MGKPIDLARIYAPENAQVIDDMKDQLLITLVKRMGGKVDIPATEMENTGENLLSFRIVNEVFMFEVSKR